MGFLETSLYGNTVLRWLIVVGQLVALLLGLAITRWLISRRLREWAARTATALDDLFVELLRRTGPLVLFLWLRAALPVLTLPAGVAGAIHGVATAALLIQIGVWGNGLLAFGMQRHAESLQRRHPGATTTISAMAFVARLVLWCVLLLIGLENLGVNVSALIAGLGIGGIAVALAVRNTLSDVLASLSIILDEPFVVGDFILVGDDCGTVEKIGLKTTRVRTLRGEQLVFANNDLLTSRLHNFKRMEERRIAFSIGVTYETPHAKLAAIPDMIRAIIEAQENARFDRAHFNDYGDSALGFEIVYYVTAADYGVYMDIQQAINLALHRRFEEEGIEFAYPTRTLRVVPAGAAPAGAGGGRTDRVT